MKKINRRNFVTAASTGFLGLALGGKSANAHSILVPGQEEGSKIKNYNAFGKTGLKVSDVIFGAGQVFSSDVIRYAFDLGVNTFDTAEHYMNGKSEELVGAGLKGIRDKAIIITKLPFWGGRPKTKQSILERMNKSLKKLQTDYVDFLFIHMIDDLSLVKDVEVRSAYEQLKKEGKVRFTGFSTHNAKGTLAECVKPDLIDFMDAILFMYNHMEGQEIEHLVKAVRQKGIGTIAMKVLAGGKQGNLKAFIPKAGSYPGAAIGWALGNKNLDCCVMTMGSFTQVDEYVAASGKKLKRDDLATLRTYKKLVDKEYCRVSCSECETACPKRVAISDIMRYAMYFEDYKQEKIALQHYKDLDIKKKPLSCASCTGPCISACPHGLPVKEKLLSAHQMLIT
jgi:predicted aldo/keto reductase-like oxidoreductase